MPITISVAQQSPAHWPGPRTASEDDLFAASCRQEANSSKGIIQSSFPRSVLRENHLSPSANGFVNAALRAYSHHHHLVIRPDDVWCAVLTQTGFYINAYAEELRHLFVTHQGQKKLEVIDAGSLEYANFGRLAIRMTGLIQKNVIDPDLKEWVMPSFSTTTETDQVVASILMMGAMQEYFSYQMTMACGIPTVTLLGEREDWCQLAERIPKLERLGTEPSRFAELLKPVLHNIISTFDQPTSPETIDFWNRIAHRHSMGSGDPRLSGWITAFCFWDESGRCLAPPAPPVTTGRRTINLELDGVQYHHIKIKDIPSGFAAVPVTVDDNGTIYHTKMLAGSVAIKATCSAPGPDGHSNADIAVDSLLDTVQPTVGWWMYEVESPEEAQERHEQQPKRGRFDGNLTDATAVHTWLSSDTSYVECTLPPSQRANDLRCKLQGVAA